VTLSAILALLVAAIMIASLLFWSATRTDGLAFQRQAQLVDQVVAGQEPRVNRMVEPFTTLAEIASEVRKPAPDLQMIDGALGTWAYTTSGMEEAYILSDKDQPIYMMIEGRHVALSSFASVRDTVMPMVRALRSMMFDPKKHLVGNYLTPGVVDYVIIHGHPAFVIVKPIVPLYSEIPGVGRSKIKFTGKPGTEYVYILVKRMDEKSLLMTKLREEHLYQHVRFSWTDKTRRGEGAHPIKSPRTGRVIGYYIWETFKPGSIVLKDMMLPLLGALLVVSLVTSFLLRRIRRSTIELQASEAQAKHLAFHDVLTGLPNRALFEDRLDRALARARRHPDQKVALLCLDVDRFKQVNDTLGHPAGDELIREIARRLSEVIRDTDTVARLGGDEFAIIQTGIRSRGDITALCKRVLKTVSDPFDIMGSQVFVGMSIGVARAGTDGFERTELARKADIALYHAKADGRGRHSIFTDSMDMTVQVRRRIEQDLRVALEKGDELRVYYQPTYDSISKAVAGVEALVRWQHPTDGLICPTLFIPIAEECGLIEPLGEWVLKEACTAALHWPIGTISVNVSAVQLRNPLFAQRALRIVHATGLEPTRLELEITETAFMDNADQCEQNIKALRAAGVRIALDDFGTGYSSLNHLHTFQVDRLKIDRSFIMGIQNSSSGSAIVRAIIDLARSSGLQVTAEGVETKEQSQFLCSIGCDAMQGYFMSRPVTHEMANEMLGVDRNILAFAPPHSRVA
jgi:diguanylate cyclase (GGDEF)-like protein